MKKFYELGERTPCGRLPKNVKFLVSAEKWDAECEPAAEYLSDNYGFCVESCSVARNELPHDPSWLKIYITNIKWDTTD